MALEILVLDATFAHYQRPVVLSGDTYYLELKWITRGNYWELTIKDNQLNHLISGVPLRSNFLCFEKFDIDDLPPGKLILVDTTELNEESTRFNFGGNKLLLYDDLS